jgi:5-methyltetrahydrofolate--homocysteine methyltransferase
MTPAASVSGFYLSHPEATYFNVGKIGEDQVQDLANRRGAELAQVQRLLGSNL